MMRGPEGAAKLAVAMLEQELPPRLEALRVALEAEPAAVPSPALVLPYDEPTLAVDEWPAVMVIVEEALSLTLAEVHTDGGESYRARYRARLFAYVRADGYREVDLLRKRYVVALREVLLARKSLTPVPTFGAGQLGAGVPGIAVDLGSIRESYSPTVVDDEGRTIASAYLDAVLVVEEFLDGPPAYGTVLTTDLRPHALERDDTAVVPHHPAL